MKKIAICMLGCLVLTGCSELQVIGRSAMSELTADAISVEGSRYRAGAERRAGRVERQTLVAKATMLDAKLGKPEKKELWRNN